MMRKTFLGPSALVMSLRKWWVLLKDRKKEEREKKKERERERERKKEELATRRALCLKDNTGI